MERARFSYPLDQRDYDITRLKRALNSAQTRADINMAATNAALDRAEFAEGWGIIATGAAAILGFLFGLYWRW